MNEFRNDALNKRYFSSSFRIIWSILAILLVMTSYAQSEKSTVLSFDEYMNIVKNNHPVAMQADLQNQIGEAVVQRARGGFDPKAYAELSQKYFDGKQYYSLSEGGLKVPTWFGIELSGGYMDNGGDFLNPQNSVPGAGLYNAGISIPIGQGLFIDERRSQLRQAQLFQESTKSIQQQIYNELLYQAGKVYWDWFNAYNNLKVYQEALALADQRFEAVKQGARLGDRPSIDTLEAGIQVQNRMLNIQISSMEFTNAGYVLSTFLWSDGVIPLEIAEETVPTDIKELSAESLDSRWIFEIDSILQNHPLLIQSQLKIDQLNIERRWKAEQLKPELNLKYNALNEPIGDEVLAGYSANNYNWGLQFSMPLFIRKERAALKLAKIKIQESELELSFKAEQLEAKARAAINQWNNTIEQINLYQRTVNDYRGLLNGEREMFNAGESSLFMVNSRELGYINAQLKLLELMTKNRKAVLETSFAFGQLGE